MGCGQASWDVGIPTGEGLGVKALCMHPNRVANEKAARRLGGLFAGPSPSKALCLSVYEERHCTIKSYFYLLLDGGVSEALLDRRGLGGS